MQPINNCAMEVSFGSRMNAHYVHYAPKTRARCSWMLVGLLSSVKGLLEDVHSGEESKHCGLLVAGLSHEAEC